MLAPSPVARFWSSAARIAGHRGEAGHHLDDLVERRAMLVGTREEALVAGDDQPGIAPLQLGRAEALLLQEAVAEVLEEHVRRGQQAVHRLAPLGRREIERDAALAAVEQREEGDPHAAEPAGLVAGRRLDLDHLGAELGQDHAAGRPHDHVAHLDDPDAVQRQMRGHAFSPPKNIRCSAL